MTKPTTARTLYDKIWDSHVVAERDDGSSIVFIDRHLIHEVTSPQAFAGLRDRKISVYSPTRTLAVCDHNVPTTDRSQPISDPQSRTQVATLKQNTQDFKIDYFDEHDKRQGIVHVIGPEQGFTLPGSTIVCGDSHTATHGAFGALAHGIGTSEVEHVLATQTLVQTKSKNMEVRVEGKLPKGVYAKDIILFIIGRIGTAGGVGHVIEYSGSAIRSLSMEGRMTVCNMSIEGGARAGLIAPDDTTFAYLKGKPRVPVNDLWDKAVQVWRQLKSDDQAHFDQQINIDINKLTPMVTWGTSPDDVISIEGKVPHLKGIDSAERKKSVERSLNYMGLNGGEPVSSIKIDTIFIGSCTNGRIEDLRESAAVLKGKKINPKIRALVVPGSGLVKELAEKEGLHRIFIEAGMEWREPGCSMCLAMNPDKLAPGERCASTSNRNFEGRQGYKGRTHLLSPAMAAAAAITGRLTDVREFM